MSDAAIPTSYKMRGPWVEEKSGRFISERAQKLVDVLGWRRRDFTRKRIGHLITSLEDYSINVIPVADIEWPECLRATVDPDTRTIYMPESLYFELHDANSVAITVFLHELGHIFLLHKPVLHFAELTPKRTEDAEWQADHFADSVIEYLKLPAGGRQLEFKNF